MTMTAHEESNGPTRSLWKREYPGSLIGAYANRDEEFDVVVIGAGIAGLTTGYLLADGKTRVAVVERRELGAGETGRTTAQCSTAYDDRYFEIEKIHGDANTRLLAQSQVEAVETMARIIAKNAIECDARRVVGYLFAGPEHDALYLDREREAANRAGLLVDRVAPVRSAFADGSWLAFPNQLQIHPMKYLLGLATAFSARGGALLVGSGVREVRWKSARSAELRLENGRVLRSRFVVTATNTPVVDLFAIHTKQAAYRTYVIAAKIPKTALPTAFYWDTSDPYHYVRLEGDPSSDEERVIIGGEDHKTGQAVHPETRWAALEEWARARIPEMGEVTDRWSGQVMEPVDGVAFAGHNPGDPAGSFIITGDSGTGMTNGTIGAKIVVDAIRGERNRYADLFSPSRKTLRSTGSYLKENLNAAGQYAEWLRIAPDDPERPLEPGEGRIEREHGAPIAVSCDRTGRISKCSAVCPHLGAILQWNSAEGTWDCPAHGSRFDGDGRILNGPANRPLRKKAPGVRTKETVEIEGRDAGEVPVPPPTERPLGPGAGVARP